MLECPTNYVEALDYFVDAEYLVLINRWSLKYFFPSSKMKQPHFINEALGCEERDVKYRDYLPLDTNGFTNHLMSVCQMRLVIYSRFHLRS